MDGSSKSKNLCNKLKNFFKNDNLELIDLQVCYASFMKAAAEIVLYDMGEKSDPYHLSNECYTGFRVMLSADIHIPPGDIEENLLIASLEDHLPFEESAIVTLLTTSPIDYIDNIDLTDFKTKKVKVTLKIDMNCFYDFEVVPIPDDPVTEIIKEFPPMSISDKEKLSKKARIVIDKINLYIYVNDGNGTEFSIKDPFGTTAIPIYLSFVLPKPFIGKRAKDLYQGRPEFIIFHLIKLCSLDRPHNLTPHWKFKVEKDKESIMVTVKTCNGEHRSSAEFLLALVLQNVLQIIKNKTDAKMEEFQIDFEGFEANEILKKNFIEAGKLAKVGILFG